MALRLTKSLTLRYPPDHEKAYQVLHEYTPGEILQDEHREFINMDLSKITVDDEAPELVNEAAKTAEPKADKDPDAPDDGLDEMKVAELKTLMEMEGIETTGSTKKSNLIETIRAHRAAEG